MARTPSVGYSVPTLAHIKRSDYRDYPLVNNETVTERPFHVNKDCTIVTSDLANTTLYKWAGTGWVAVSGLVSPDVIVGRGYFAVTTAANAYVVLTEHDEPQ